MPEWLIANTMERFIALFFGLIPISRSPRVGSGARGWPPSWRTFPGLREGIQIHGRNLYLLIKKKVQFTLVCMSGRTSIPGLARLWNSFRSDADIAHGRSGISISDDKPEKVGKYQDALPTLYEY